MDLHVKIDDEPVGYDDPIGHYLIDGVIQHEQEDGQVIVVTVTRVETRTLRLDDSGELLERIVAAMRSLGDSDSPRRSVAVVRTVDRAMESLKKADPQWCEPSNSIDPQNPSW